MKSFVATLCSTGASAVAITTKRQKEYKLQKLKHSKQGNLNKIRTGKITLTIIQQPLVAISSWTKALPTYWGLRYMWMWQPIWLPKCWEPTEIGRKRVVVCNTAIQFQFLFVFFVVVNLLPTKQATDSHKRATNTVSVTQCTRMK